MHSVERTALGRVWITTREYITHWVVAGVIISLTGIVPEEWFARLIDTLELPATVRYLWPENLDPRFVVFTVGVSIIVASVSIRQFGSSRTNAKSPAKADTKPPDLNAPRLSIVVLPFQNLSSDPEQEYFADGITEDLTTDLSRVPGSFVVAAKSALTFKGKTIDVKEIGRQLGIRYAIEGSLRRIGSQIRVNAQLIDASSGAHLWADRFDGDMSDIAQLQDEVTARLARSLDAELVATESARAQRERRENPDAVDLMMRGRAALNKPHSRETGMEARYLFEQALGIDSHNVDALVGLALALSSLAMSRMSPSLAQDSQRAYEAAKLALTLKPDFAAGYYALGTVLQLQGKHTDSRAAFERAISLNPNFAPAFAMLGQEMHFLAMGEKTAELVQKAMRLSPRDPDFGFWMSLIGFSYHFLARDDDAIEWLGKSVLASSKSSNPYLFLASSYAHKGNLAEAGSSLAIYNTLVPNMTVSQLRADRRSDNLSYLARRERLYAGLKIAGMPED